MYGSRKAHTKHTILLSAMMPIASEEHQEPPETYTHNPSAPSHELFDISTAVDPSYVISLIRKLIPSNAKNRSHSSRDGKYETTGECTLSEEKVENAVCQSENWEAQPGPGSAVEVMDIVNVVNDDNGLQHYPRNYDRSVEGDPWEEYGCTLWDLAASETHAELMVQNLILEVLLTNITCSRSARVTEICLGILGNLACHEVPQKQITLTNGLVETILDQLFSDDAPCLREALRLITLCLQGAESVLWANALKSELIISRILWISENALNLQLLEKSVGLFSAIAESSQEVAFVLLPPLFNLGLPNILISLLDFEMSTLTREKDSERYSILDFILRTIEALSTLDDYSQQICVRKDLFQLLNALIKLPDKIEVAGSCISAAVLLANILTDAPDLGLEASQDIHFLQGLFEIFPLASDDAEAQSALWSILARLLCQVKEGEMSFVRLHQYASVLASKSELIEEELLNHNSDPKEADEHPNNITTRKAILLSLRRISDILTQWTSSKEHSTESDREKNYVNEECVDKLKGCINKYEARTVRIPTEIMQASAIFSIGVLGKTVAPGGEDGTKLVLLLCYGGATKQSRILNRKVTLRDACYREMLYRKIITEEDLEELLYYISCMLVL